MAKQAKTTKAQKTTTVTLLCDTFDRRDHGCCHCILSLDRRTAAELLIEQQTLEDTFGNQSGHRWSTLSFYAVELWQGYEATWGYLRDGPDEVIDWQVLPSPFDFKPTLVECSTLKIMRDGVSFHASIKHDDDNYEMTTPVLSWGVIRKMLDEQLK